MSRGVWVYDPISDRMIPKGEFLRLKAERSAHSRSNLGRPMVIGAMAPIRSMADGQWYDDKRSYQRSLARNGCEVVGFDRDWQRHVKPATQTPAQHEADIVGDIKKSIEQVSSGNFDPTPLAFGDVTESP